MYGRVHINNNTKGNLHEAKPLDNGLGKGRVQLKGKEIVWF